MSDVSISISFILQTILQQSVLPKILPTLQFSIGAAVFPGMVVTMFVALVVATILLAVAATGGVHAFFALYFFFALIFSGLRFTNEGASCAMIQLFVALNTMDFVSKADEEGLQFVLSLWTESGTTNPNGESIINCFIAFQ